MIYKSNNPKEFFKYGLLLLGFAGLGTFNFGGISLGGISFDGISSGGSRCRFNSWCLLGGAGSFGLNNSIKGSLSMA